MVEWKKILKVALPVLLGAVGALGLVATDDATCATCAAICGGK